MSKNISKLSGRIGLKDNLFQKLSKRSLSSKNGEGIKELAEKYHVKTVDCANKINDLFVRKEMIELADIALKRDK